MEGRLGTDNLLIKKPVPAVPVVPVQNPAICRSITDPADAEGENGQDGRARESHSRRPGTTGTTGTDEDFCAFPVPTVAKENGNEWEHGLRETARTNPVGPDHGDWHRLRKLCRGGTVGPLLLRDGRRMWRFDACEIASARTDIALVSEARWHRAVLVADGYTLVVVERWLSTLPDDLLRALREEAGAVISALRHDHRLPLLGNWACAADSGE